MKKYYRNIYVGPIADGEGQEGFIGKMSLYNELDVKNPWWKGKDIHTKKEKSIQRDKFASNSPVCWINKHSRQGNKR